MKKKAFYNALQTELYHQSEKAVDRRAKLEKAAWSGEVPEEAAATLMLQAHAELTAAIVLKGLAAALLDALDAVGS